MSYPDLVRSHVERCLQDAWNVCRATPDRDGDYRFRRGTAQGYVRIEPGEPTLVRVWAVAARGVPRSARLLREINDVNVRCRLATVCWREGTVLVQHALFPETVDRTALEHACDTVGRVAEDIGTLVASVFGGVTPFPVAGRSAAGGGT